VEVLAAFDKSSTGSGWTSITGGTTRYNDAYASSMLSVRDADQTTTFAASQNWGKAFLYWGALGLTLTGGPPQLSIRGVATNPGNTVTIPRHTKGDLILIYAFKGDGATLPTKPAAAGTVPAYTDIDANPGVGGAASRTAYFVADGSTETSGTWTGATEMTAVVLGGQNASTPIGGHAEGGGSGASTSHYDSPSVTLTQTDGSSYLLYFYGLNSAGNPWQSSTALAGYSRLATGKAVVVNTKDDTTSDGIATEATPAGTGATSWRTAVVEIRA
jgi:hypothetical protein